ncbi:MAG TPA: type II secretion system ATPase GspE [Verrucomicrobiae bacterium]|nr:type II secretion system ATPase GspE [Verrucomicrobiae bacterium]
MFESEAAVLTELLRERSLVSPEQMRELQEEHDRTGKPLTQIIVDFGLMSEDQLLQAVAEHLNLEFLNLESVDLQQNVLRSMPSSVARMYGAVPVSLQGNTITVAVLDPYNPQLVEELSFVLGKDVQLAVAPSKQIESAISRYYSEESGSLKDVLEQMEDQLASAEVVETVTKGGAGVAALEELASQAPIVRFVNLILFQAIQDRASDIHFEPFEDEFKIRYRVDGALYEMAPPPKHLSLPVISRIKVMSNLNIAERRLPQDGRIQINLGGKQVDLRVSTLPTQFGESVVLRVLDRTVVNLEIESLGLPDDIREKLNEIIHIPNGIVIVTGPTGSGKTTTLYSCLKRINTVDLKLLTAEDPVEYDIEGIMQVPVNEGVGMTFARALRSFLRQDPDVIMVGEMRDLETAQISIQASLTGHLVFTTLHTNDAPGAVTRMIDMGVEPFLITSTLEGVLAQRLVRTVCKKCKVAYEPTESVLSELGLTRADVQGRPFYYGKGCLECNETGYKGRKGLFEFLIVSEPIRELINMRAPSGVIRAKALELGMRTLREDGIHSILDGVTTVEEVLKYT